MAFGRKTEVRHVIEMDDETRQALVSLENDLQVLREMQHDVIAQGQSILAALQGQVIAAREEYVAHEVEVRPDADEVPYTRSGSGLGVRAFVTEIPEALQGSGDLGQTVPEEDRIRETPFNRVPRSVQVEWLIDVLKEAAGWVAPSTVADYYANDERHRRYLKSIITSRLREMHEEGLVSRRSSKVRGSMFEYCYRPKEASH